jgi:magnesium transporter
MHKNKKQRSKKVGHPPGSLIHVGERKKEKAQIKLIKYSEATFEETDSNIEDICHLDRNNSIVHWINVEGIHDVNLLESLGKCFGIHPLVLEDILNTDQRPKIEDYGQYIFMVVKMLSYDTNKGEIITEQQSFILGDNFVISFSESDTNIFDPVREWIKHGIGRIRKMGADFLVFTLLDVIVDNYFVVLDELSEKIENTEDEMVEKSSPETLQTIHKLKRNMLFLHKSVWPLREIIGTLDRGVTPLIKDSIDIYIRDLYDHVIQVMDTTETLRDILSSMLDIYLSSVSNRMNEIMKVLTIISTVFIPLSFIVGLYGMNLKNMPEYGVPWMYPVVWIIMISIAIVMLIFFKKKKWW